MIIPGHVTFSVIPKDGTNPGMDGPLNAIGILQALTTALDQRCGTKINSSFSSVVKSQLQSLLEYQAAIRSLPKPPDTLYLVDTEMMGHQMMIRYGLHWLSNVDAYLQNRDCERCGGSITVGFSHKRYECDAILARDVLES